ncbi:bifunctional folylpolyglutamate synthase/dihydrofolate synthase [Candidatus Sulfurimonas baltica]|uniref:Bifunctional folylpolyglutamate synthase/dihydrofolate synthase n=2 Tax=Candidatus Sulfurimonas baltica TaxID=2740404 RepID=A0A7S7LXU6_9BACT|nr:bifunctional folylpolyglutamate synthase/dihydrofolate synthase [Candidatus Sulfurimonas baltica]
MPRIYEKIKSSLHIPKIVHIIGTNGKGTTGRFLAQALHSIGLNCGHYTSPHILKFNERVWLNGNDSSDEILENSHVDLQKLLPKSDLDSLSYFEYTTLLAMIAFAGCDYIIMEAGLGGEFDATAVFPKCLTLVTPIAMDHESFLGSTIEEIATTKLNAIQNSAILAFQNESDVYKAANDIAEKKSVSIYKIDEFLDENDRKNIDLISKELSLAPYLSNNLSLSISALNFLKIEYDIANFKNAKLFGRLSKIGKNVIVDVGHNPLAAKSIVDALSPDKYIIIYNSYKDKNYKDILQILKPICLHVEIIEIDDERIESVEVLKSTLTSLKIKYTIFKEVKPNYNYLVFGSFSVVEAFLKGHNV